MDSNIFTTISDNDNIHNDKLIFCVILIIFLVCGIWYISHCKNNVERMSGGVVQQMMAMDGQNQYLNSIDNLVVNNGKNMAWNYPSKIFSTFHNRGTPITTIVEPSSSILTNSNMLDINDQVVQLNCVNDPASCGSGAGGRRLGQDLNDPPNNNNLKPFVGLLGNIDNYENSYTGTYYTPPLNDIMRPLH